LGVETPEVRASPHVHFVLDPTRQISLFVKLKLEWCARAGDRAGLCRVRRRRATRIRAREPTKDVLPMTPALVLRIDIRCYLPLIAAHVLVFARE
jgi:hypothetical protein